MEDSRTEFSRLLAEKLQDLGNYLLILFSGPIFIPGITITYKVMSGALGLVFIVTLYLFSYRVFPKGESHDEL